MIFPLSKVGCWNPLLLVHYSLSLLLALLILALHIWVFWCWVHIYLLLLYPLAELTSQSLYNNFIYLFSQFLKSILAYIVTPVLLWFPLHGISSFYPFTFSLCVSLQVKWVSCRQHIVGSCFLIHAATLCFFNCRI